MIVHILLIFDFFQNLSMFSSSLFTIADFFPPAGIDAAICPVSDILASMTGIEIISGGRSEKKS